MHCMVTSRLRRSPAPRQLLRSLMPGIPLTRLKPAHAALIGALAIGPAHGQTVDLSTLKCREFIELSKETIFQLTIWLDGYFTDEEDAAVFEPDKLKIKAEKLTAFCAQNPKIGLMTAAENSIAK